MLASAVTVLDGQGRPTSAQDAAIQAGTSNGEHEAYLEAQVHKLLRPLLGQAGSMTVAVSVARSQQQTRSVREALLPSGQWRGMPTGLLQSGKLRYAEDAPAGLGSAVDPALDGNTELSFSHGRTVDQAEEAPGRIQRISASVIINDAVMPARRYRRGGIG